MSYVEPDKDKELDFLMTSSNGTEFICWKCCPRTGINPEEYCVEWINPITRTKTMSEALTRTEFRNNWPGRPAQGTLLWKVSKYNLESPLREDEELDSWQDFQESLVHDWQNAWFGGGYKNFSVYQQHICYCPLDADHMNHVLILKSKD